MPIIKSAIKKMGQDKKKRVVNKKRDKKYLISISKAKKSKKNTDVRKALSNIDKAVRSRRIHKNKAFRLKSIVSKLIKKK